MTRPTTAETATEAPDETGTQIHLTPVYGHDASPDHGYSLNDKFVVINGAASGIGCATAESLADAVRAVDLAEAGGRSVRTCCATGSDKTFDELKSFPRRRA